MSAETSGLQGSPPEGGHDVSDSSGARGTAESELTNAGKESASISRPVRIQNSDDSSNQTANLKEDLLLPVQFFFFLTRLQSEARRLRNNIFGRCGFPQYAVLNIMVLEGKFGDCVT